MTKVYSKALDQTISIDRLIGQIKGEKSGPTIVFFAGIHGNEPASVFALKQVFDELKFDEVNGAVYGIAGNLPALAKGIRHEKEDLNRIWTEERLASLTQKTTLRHEDKEQAEIHALFQGILKKEKGPFYFIDLHTTSSETIPFLTVNDNLINRKFTSHYPVPMVLGIEEYLEGPLLSYINELGYIAFGFEAGQHDTLNAIINHKSFVAFSLILAGSIVGGAVLYNKHFNQLNQSSQGLRKVFEIYYRYSIEESEAFTMQPGFANFMKIEKGTPLALSNGKDIIATHAGHILMPLYQGQGDDGFFAIRSIPRFFLSLSALLRKVRFDQFLRLLPGVSRPKGQKNVLLVNLKIARFFTKEFFHLLGYRSKQINGHHLLMKNRERFSKKSEYRNERWHSESS